MGFTQQQQERIEKAAHTNLIGFCQSKGIALRREYGEYILTDNDSVNISIREPWKWYRHSTGEGGKAIDFCTKFLGMNFREAVQELTSQSFDITVPEPLQLKPYQPNTAQDQKRIIAYLCQKRGINYKIVTELIQADKLKQDIKGNCVFEILDFDGNKVGAELHGTGDKRFKGQTNPQDGFGFSLVIGKPDKIAYFESAIDLLSFKQIFSTATNIMLVSMGGLKATVLENYRQQYPQAINGLCVDNDPKGHEFVEQHKDCNPCFKSLEKYNCKDWNELLLQRKK